MYTTHADIACACDHVLPLPTIISSPPHVNRTRLRHYIHARTHPAFPRCGCHTHTHTYRIREVAQMLHRLRFQALVALLARQQHARVRGTHEAVRPGSDLAAGISGVIIIMVAVVAVVGTSVDRAGRCNGIGAADTDVIVVSKFAAL